MSSWCGKTPRSERSNILYLRHLEIRKIARFIASFWCRFLETNAKIFYRLLGGILLQTINR